MVDFSRFFLIGEGKVKFNSVARFEEFSAGNAERLFRINGTKRLAIEAYLGFAGDRLDRQKDGLVITERSGAAAGARNDKQF